MKNKRNAKLLLIGEGYNKDRIIDFAEQKNIASDVIFYGLSNEVSSLMSAMDMFVLPSRFEGLPCVLIEAQAAGLPCIVSDQVSKEAKLTH
ncbi:MAG TPA: glycosyltransferase family 1 protein, partial [Clostridium sp.]|nr:glycosyltransferase family 1 protein [Clostridium sp.]